MTKKAYKDSLSRSSGCPMDGEACTYPCSKLLDAKLESGQSDHKLAGTLGLHHATWMRYRQGRQCPPLAVCGYLSVLAGRLPWPGWEHYSVNPHNRRLFNRDLRYGFDPDDLKAVHWKLQELQWYKTKFPLQRDITPDDINVVRITEYRKHKESDGLLPSQEPDFG